MATLDSLQTSVDALTARVAALELAQKAKADLGADGTVVPSQIPFASAADLNALLTTLNAPTAPAVPSANLLPPGTVARLAAGLVAGQSVRVPLHLSAGKYKLLLNAAGLVGGGLGVVLLAGEAWVAGTSTKLVAGPRTIILTVPATGDYALLFDAGDYGGGLVTLPVLTPSV